MSQIPSSKLPVPGNFTSRTRQSDQVNDENKRGDNSPETHEVVSSTINKPKPVKHATQQPELTDSSDVGQRGGEWRPVQTRSTGGIPPKYFQGLDTTRLCNIARGLHRCAASGKNATLHLDPHTEKLMAGIGCHPLSIGRQMAVGKQGILKSFRMSADSAAYLLELMRSSLTRLVNAGQMRVDSNIHHMLLGFPGGNDVRNRSNDNRPERKTHPQELPETPVRNVGKRRKGGIDQPGGNLGHFLTRPQILDLDAIAKALEIIRSNQGTINEAFSIDSKSESFLEKNYCHPSQIDKNIVVKRSDDGRTTFIFPDGRGAEDMLERVKFVLQTALVEREVVKVLRGGEKTVSLPSGIRRTLRNMKVDAFNFPRDSRSFPENDGECDTAYPVSKKQAEKILKQIRRGLARMFGSENRNNTPSDNNNRRDDKKPPEPGPTRKM